MNFCTKKGKKRKNCYSGQIYTFDTSSLLDNETIYLNGSYTGSDEKGTLENPYKSINTAMSNLLDSNKTNLFIADGDYTINNHFDINKNINIIGESTTGVKINCNKDYLFAFTNSSSNIYNLTIYNSYSNTEYAVIWTELSNITMCNVVFTNNLVHTPGGIILTEGGTFKLINSSIKNNLIDYVNGTLDEGSSILGGIIYSDDNDLIIINSSFDNNTIKSYSYSGGAIYAKGNLEFINSTVSGLYVYSDYVIQGAFIYYIQSDIEDHFYMINSSLDKSNFSYVSGLILTDSLNSIIKNVNISDNYALYLQGNISVLDLYYTSSIENLNCFNNTYKNVSISFLSKMNFLYRNGYFNISEPLPDRYDLREYNLTTSVKNQNPLGTCWAFATIGALESYLLKNWNETFDLSENTFLIFSISSALVRMPSESISSVRIMSYLLTNFGVFIALSTSRFSRDMIELLSSNKLSYSLTKRPSLFKLTLSSSSSNILRKSIRLTPISLPLIKHFFPSCKSILYNLIRGALFRQTTISPSSSVEIGKKCSITPSILSLCASIEGTNGFTYLTIFLAHLYDIERGNTVVLGKDLRVSNDSGEAPINPYIA